MFMKKILSLLTLLLCVVGSAQAGDVFTVSFNGSDVQSTDGYFTFSGNHNFNSKFAGTYDGVEYTKGLKMEGSTTISFTSSAEATVTVVQSTWLKSGVVQTVKLDGDEIENRTMNETDKYCENVVENVQAGTHTITRGGGESGVFLIKVEYTGAVLTALSAPTINFDATTGEVTIVGDENATKVTYTTDGTDPTDESTEYAASFTVEDGVIVKAIAIGDQASYANSEIASVQVLLEGVEVQTPVAEQLNGTVALSCATPAVTLEYSLDGINYTAYTRPFTLLEDGTVFVRATRGESVAETEVAVTAVTSELPTQTIFMDFNRFDVDGNVMTGKEDYDTKGYTLTIDNAEKSWSELSGAYITIDDIDHLAIKLSNGAKNILTLPEGVVATRMALYSVINAAAGRTCYWKEFNGTAYDDAFPMGAWTGVEDRLKNADVRVFPLNGDETEITFTNAGEQLGFVIALDVVFDETTGIKTVETVKSAQQGVYNLQGQRMQHVQKGLYIVNGKKVIK